MANPLESCVSSLRSTNALLSSSISILDSGVNDFPRLAKVLQTTRVCPSFNTSIIPRSRFKFHNCLARWHQLAVLIINPAFRTPPRIHPPIRPILPPRLFNTRSRLAPFKSRIPPRQARPSRTSSHSAQRVARRPDRRRTRIHGRGKGQRRPG